MRIHELWSRGGKLLTEAPAKKYGETSYGTWQIRYNLTKNPNGKFGAIGFHVRNSDTPKHEAASSEEAIALVKADIDALAAQDNSTLAIKKATVDYNANFTREIMSEFGGPTGVRIIKDGGGPMLVVAGVEFVDAFGAEAFGQGDDKFTKFHQRLQSSSDADETEATSAPVFSSPLTVNQIKSLGLKPNGRYSLEYSHSDDAFGHQYFRLVFDSITASKHDKRRLNKPGLTIAVS